MFLQGQPRLSYNNYVDCLSAYQVVAGLDDIACVNVKHRNPCGFGVGKTALDAYKRAVKTDPISYFGGIVGVNCTVDEELAEVKNALGDEAMRDEIGDLLFAVVNLARWFDIDAEEALRMANKRFRDRFYYIEKKARAMNQQVSDYSLDELLEFWKEAKETLSN